MEIILTSFLNLPWKRRDFHRVSKRGAEPVLGPQFWWDTEVDRTWLLLVPSG